MVWMLVILKAPTFLVLLDEDNNVNNNIDRDDVVWTGFHFKGIFDLKDFQLNLEERIRMNFLCESFD